LIRISLCVALLWVPASAPAAAQDRLAEAEEAYLEVDFPRARALAREALEEGGHSPGDVARIYRLIAIAAAADGDDPVARDAFARMIALGADEDGADLSPRLRQPLLEAQGAWAARDGDFRVEARRLRGDRGLALRLEDPLNMAARVVAVARLEGAAEPARLELDAAEELHVPVEGLTAEASVELHAWVLDAHGNRLLELGSAIEPQMFEGAAAVSEPTPEAPAPSDEWRLSPWLLTVPVGLTAVSAALLTWSTVDVLQSHDAYLADPTLDGYYAGLDLQTRTNVLIGVTAGLAAVSVAWAIFLTDWADEEEPARAVIAPSVLPAGGGLTMLGRFR